jgi:anti-sigma B factor antagonist
MVNVETGALMKTAIGVFAFRERAEDAVKTLLERHIPEERIVFLTRSESEAKGMARQLRVSAGGEGPECMSAGIGVAAVLTVPGVDSVFALGSGAVALLGLSDPKTSVDTAGRPNGPIPSERASAEDFALFCRVLSEGHSVVVVRTESSQIATTACEVLNRLGISMQAGVAAKSTVTSRQLVGAVVADFVGKIALTEGSGLLRETLRTFLEQGHTRILLNLERVDFIDSAGLGELVRTHAAVRSRGGQLKLVRPSDNVHQLLRITKLDRVLEIVPDEFSALNSLRQDTLQHRPAGSGA